VDKLEFVIGMIVKLKMLEWADVEPFIKQFDALDTDGSGKLDKADLERAAELTAQPSRWRCCSWARRRRCLPWGAPASFRHLSRPPSAQRRFTSTILSPNFTRWRS